MEEIGNKILLFLDSGYNIEDMLRKLNIDEETLADAMIELENNEIVTLKDRNWTLTQKGLNILKDRKESLKKLKVEYLHGNISKDIFQKRRLELESITTIEKSVTGYEEYGSKQEKDGLPNENKEKINCPKCGKENKIDSKYCYKCGELLK